MDAVDVGSGVLEAVGRRVDGAQRVFFVAQFVLIQNGVVDPVSLGPHVRHENLTARHLRRAKPTARTVLKTAQIGVRKSTQRLDVPGLGEIGRSQGGKRGNEGRGKSVELVSHLF